MNEIGDKNFKGVNELVDPAFLPECYVSYSVNKRFIEGRWCDRGGHNRTFWTNLSSDSKTSPVAAGTVYDVCEYKKTSGSILGILFHATSASIILPGNHRTTISYPDGVSIDGTVSAVQIENQLFVFIGEGETPMYWEEGDNSFSLVNQEDTGNSYIRMPKGAFGIHYYDRLWVFFENELYPSLTSNKMLFDPTLVIPVGKGESSAGTGIYEFNQSGLIVVKDNSVYAVVNIDASLENTIAQNITSIIGSSARKSIISDGSSMWMPSTTGIYMVNQAFETRLEAKLNNLAKPLSRSYNNINFSLFNNICGIGHGGYYYWAVPTASSTKNDMVFVYSVNDNEWQGIDINPIGYDVVGWLRLILGGKTELVGVSSEGYCFIYGTDSQLESGAESQGISRGYSNQQFDSMATNSFRMDIKTQNPNYSVLAQYDGVNENRVITTDETKDRTKYTTFGTADWVATNASLDFNNPHREDYTLVADSTGFKLDIVGTSSYAVIDLRQDFNHNFQSNRGCRFVQIKTTNSQGYLETIAIYSINRDTGNKYTSNKTI